MELQVASKDKLVICIVLIRWRAAPFIKTRYPIKFKVTWESLWLIHHIICFSVALSWKRTSIESERPKMQKQVEQKEAEEVEAIAIWDCGSPLYDSYELVSLSHLIERHLMALPSDHCGPRRITGRFSDVSEVGSARTLRSLWKRRMKEKEITYRLSSGFYGLLNRIGFRRK